ncbi:uncharacterized protein LOC110443880 [Mizuhopecten yessoensis]|uniref:CUB domain-containing protein n=1 Tax=Mizuhopecten yessoensis TaxID=6573 RepID=A0A210PDY7_MIZYE|nr:uncharacterized protein LOC110443880 [Mizuhopecten yessoensis]OWF34676.1 hypothetical protein KP79_PYT11445 [Mizuhopecten yessoensis]
MTHLRTSMSGVLVALVVMLQGVHSMTSTKSMTALSRANLPVHVNDSVIVELTEQILEERSGKFLHCAVDVITDPSRRLLLHFLSMDISKDNLTPDRLHIYDYRPGGAVKQVTPVMGLFGVYDSYFKDTSPGVMDYKSSRNKLRLDYMGKPNLLYSGFRILITSFQDLRSDDCDRLHHHCGRAQICVPLSVMCDDEYNCGDGDQTDENTCHLVVDPEWKGAEATITAVVAAGVAISVFLLVIVAVLCFLKKQNRRSYIRQQSVQIYAKRKANGEWTVGNNIDTLGVTELYAPPTYEDAVKKEVNEEPPPAYDVVSTLPQSQLQGSPYSVRSVNRVTVVCIERPCDNDNIDNLEECQTEIVCIAAPEQAPDRTDDVQNVTSCPQENASLDNEPLISISNKSVSKSDDCSQSCSSGQEEDSGTYAEESSQESGSSNLEEDLISVTSDFQMTDGKSYLDNATTKSGEKTPDYSNRICLMNCDDIEYVDTVDDVNGNGV